MGNSIYDEILDILQEVRPEIDFKNEEGLLTNELLDSFDVIAILSLLMDRFSVEINVEEIILENFDSIDRIYLFIESKINL